MSEAFRPGRAFLFRMKQGSDILESLTAFCEREKVKAAAISVIGATSEVTVGYYDQVRHEYHRKTFRQEMEILSCLGNASLKEGKPFLHLHAAMGDVELRVWGGHLFPGSKVFAAEAHVQELDGPERARFPDAATGLALWKCAEG